MVNLPKDFCFLYGSCSYLGELPNSRVEPKIGGPLDHQRSVAEQKSG